MGDKCNYLVYTKIGLSVQYLRQNEKLVILLDFTSYK
jgi:hypothetical protein